MNAEFIKIRDYLDIDGVEYIRQSMIGILGLINLFDLAVINFLNDMGLKQSIYQPKNIIYLGILIFFDLWGVYIFINTKKKQKSFVLYSGMVGLISSVFYILIFCEGMFFELHNKAIIYVVICIIIYIYILVTEISIIKQYEKEGYNQYNRRIYKRKLLSIFITVVVIVICFADMATKYPNKNFALISVSFATLIFGYIFENLIHNIYRYYLVKKYQVEFDRYMNKKLRK
ncbi:hypothetical protein CSC2_39650 [Clostridium zeae]|uniref:Uncharacterized protein n=1 Tax=Clostridium zeae TaxID=2759022 RepID=A0ABQ1EF50_9CLOT|nr:hypothetical protein [Clostridium zeae]GFZ33439.1 hypothetical protein CSC2_39650 [Clostridium zeae]